MNLCDEQVFVELRAKAARLLADDKEIGKCCTVDCIIGEFKKFCHNI